ncbi:MAG: radical SAM protein [Candidatus Zixiibacteriota bacterium]
MSIGSFVNKRLLSAYQRAKVNLHELRYIFFELTHRCNLSCLHCGSDCVRETNVPDLPADDVLRVLREIKLKYNPHEISVVLSGGEPVCYPGVFDLGRKIVDMEFPWGMVTNGYAWTKDTISAAKTSRLHSITVSLDGLAPEHNWLRGRSNSFERAVDTIKMLVDDPFYQAMDVVTCINKRNLGAIDETYQLIKDLGVKQWRLFTISPIGRALDHSELFLDAGEFRHLLGKIADYRTRNEIGVTYSESGYLGTEVEKGVRDQCSFCQAGISVAGVMLNGDILACPNVDRRFGQGNIGRDSFIDVWENGFTVFRDRSWMKTGQCRECSEWSLCRGNSFHLWDIENKKTRVCHYKLLNEAPRSVNRTAQ